MLFSIVIPTYNRARILEETLKSVLEQSYSRFEVLVVDDGSTDDTRERVMAIDDSRIRYFYKQNEERGVARNYGADRALGKYLIFLDSDDRMDPTHLESIQDFIARQDTTPLFIFAGYRILNPDHTHLYSFGLDGFFEPQKLIYGNYLGCSSVVIATDVFKCYYFNPDRKLVLFEDWELWLRVIADNRLYCFSGKSIVMMNHEGRSVLNHEAADFEEKLRHFRSCALKPGGLISRSTLYKRLFLNGIYSYAALHIAMTGRNKSLAFTYFLRSLANNPCFIFKKRCYAIVKHLL